VGPGQLEGRSLRELLPDELERHTGLSLSGRRLFVAGASAALLGLLSLSAAEMNTAFAAKDLPGGALDDLDALAALLFGHYMLPFEAASLLLLATMVAVIVLAKRQRARTTEEAPGARGEKPQALESGAAR